MEECDCEMIYPILTSTSLNYVKKNEEKHVN